ncbi:MAG: HAMP domain-containing histidine kinase [Chloroflexi bacterium]|nr:HAMP domain-containing histidine kinase [Chloroflexota bacterium]
MAKIFRSVGGTVLAVGLLSLILSPIFSETYFANLWGVEPLAYIGAVVMIVGLLTIALSYILPEVIERGLGGENRETDDDLSWSEVTQQYFELFDHDLGRPLRRILGKERELSALLKASGDGVEPSVKELLDEIERQAPNFRLMMSNIRVLVQLESPEVLSDRQPVEPSEVVRRIVDRYTPVATEAGKRITWWAEPSEFGIVYADSSSIEHVVTNLVDNAVRFATTHVEVKLTKNPSHFFIRVWDDGPGIASQYSQHLFDRGWTPEVARREEKTSSGLGLFIARTVARRHGGDLSVESSTEIEHYTAFLLSLPTSG